MTRSLVGVGAVLTLALSVPAWALDPRKAITQYWLDTWGVKDGLPGHSITDIEQTRDGHVWLATHAGLIRFDGVTFKVLDEPSSGGLKQSMVWSLSASRDGGLWAGVGGVGIARYDHGLLRPHPFDAMDSPARTPFGTVVVQEALDGRLWAAANEWGVIRARGRTVDFRAPVELVRVLLEEPDGTLWVGTWSEGLIRIRNGEVARFGREHGLAGPFVSAVCRGRDGTLWIGGRDGLTALRSGRFRVYTTRDGLSHDDVRAVLEDRDGSLWIGTAMGGLCRFRDGVFSVRRRAQGLSDDEISALHEDDEGGLWIGTRGNLDRLRNTSVTMYTAEEGLPVDFVVQARPARDGGLWISTYGGGLSHLKDGRFTTWDGRHGLPNLYLGALYEARDGALWMGVGSNQLCRLRDGKVTIFETGKRYVKAIGEDQRGLLIALSRSGLHRLEQDRVVMYRTEAGQEIRDRYINTIHQGRDGTLWVAGNDGLVSVREGRLHAYGERDGLPPGEVYSLHEDADGTYWVGGVAGLLRLKDGRFRGYPGQPGLDDPSKFTLLDDRSGNLWLNSNRGVVRVAKAELHAYADGRSQRVASRIFGNLDGLKPVELRGPAIQRGGQTPDGRMWFPTPKGLAVVDPENLITDRKVPPVLVEKVVMDGKESLGRDGIEVPAGTEKVEIHYTALTYTAPERASFRYRLEGFDGDWVDAGTRRVAHYTKLPPGRYRFHVRAANRDGVWNEKGASLSLSQRPRLHQTLWFQSLAILGTALALFAVHRVRVRQLTADIAERKRGELALRQAEQKYRSIFENAVEGIFQSTPDGRFLAVNPALARMLGYDSPQQMLAEVTDIEGQLYQDAGRRRELLRRAGESGVVHGFECELRRRDGSTLWVSVNVQAVRDPAGRILYLEGTSEDMSDRRRAEELRDSLRRSEAMGAMGTLVAGVAHEVRNPLFAISANLDTLEAKVGARTEFARSIALMRGEASRLTHLMRDLLEYGKPVASARTPESIDVVVQEAIQSCAVLAVAKEVKVVSGGASGLPQVPMDRKRMVQVLQNLLQNAIELSPGGGVVSVEASREEGENGGRAVLTVKDRGPGFLAEDLGRVFEPFFSRRRGGTGMGLAIAHRIVEAHHGTISAGNRPDGGAVVTVTLPYA